MGQGRIRGSRVWDREGRRGVRVGGHVRAATAVSGEDRNLLKGRMTTGSYHSSQNTEDGRYFKPA